MALHHDDAQVARNRLEIIAVTTAMCIVGTIAIILRIFSRYFIVRNPGKDDWSMVVAWVISLGYYTETLVDWKLGLGMRSTMLRLEDMIAIMKSSLAIELTYYVAVYFIKSSIILLYLRFATQKRFRILCEATIALLSIYTLICVVVIILQCRPVAKLWDVTGTLPATCINSGLFFLITASFNLASDIWVTILPIKTLIGIQSPMREKVALIFVFAMGTFSCVAAMIRLKALVNFTHSKDVFFDTVPLDIWSSIEINVAILCSSMPSLKPLLFYWSRSERNKRINHGPNSKGYIRSNASGSGSGNNRRIHHGDPEAIPGSFAMTSRLNRENNSKIMDASSDTESTENILTSSDGKIYIETRVEITQNMKMEHARNMV
ncbi:hypothetical protein K432DRAFT_409804 [Lepidopterella palustris CBS 459.81]|uniref:Rhodopsin domain-containing protein n=1 Tax=Lepidopterella palustris CBS 459.81 TaxID=1314670 RepID=A0A8E2DZ99_9PEZI|nr:hypothetical protein K432DRAFT_409804 [Lepidopterella palustris CBS 459.81]